MHLLRNHILQLSCKIVHQVIKLFTHFVRILDKIHSIDNRTGLGWCKLWKPNSTNINFNINLFEDLQLNVL